MIGLEGVMQHCGNEIHVSIFKFDRDIDVIEIATRNRFATAVLPETATADTDCFFITP
jgi:hypothetical protein